MKSFNPEFTAQPVRIFLQRCAGRSASDGGGRRSPRRLPAVTGRASAARAFSLVELLVVVAIMAVLLAVLLPALGSARGRARQVHCAANLHQLGHGLHLYANDAGGALMPLAYTAGTATSGPELYWWGANVAGGVDRTRGFLWPYLSAELRSGGLFECAQQPRESYVAQGAAAEITSTYGYNGYYLTPAQTPGWSHSIRERPWRRMETVAAPAAVFAFADTLLLLAGQPRNVALLDPPLLFAGGRWSMNPSPTTAFRHDGRANALGVDGHAAAYRLEGAKFASPALRIGSVGSSNDPHYVPDWRDW